tara:strand:- start:102 stop:446 length:345 start_codon:yes stop_codon:yes gene_type:complete
MTTLGYALLGNLRRFPRVQPLPLFKELLMCFLMLRVKDAAVYRANVNALFGFRDTDTLGAFVGVNHIDCLLLGNCLIFTVWFTGTATDTLICNFICHNKLYLLLILFFKGIGLL